MIGRLFAIGLVSTFTAVMLAGVAAVMGMQIFGAAAFEKLWSYATTPRPKSAIEKELEGTRDFSFFKSVKVEGRPFSITMGVSFATPEDFAAGRQKGRWCYTMLQPADGGVPRQIELATQEGQKPPRYNDLSNFSAAELAALGETRQSLSEIARKHCVFTKEPARPGAVARRFTTIVLKGAPAKGETT